MAQNQNLGDCPKPFQNWEDLDNRNNGYRDYKKFLINEGEMMESVEE